MKFVTSLSGNNQAGLVPIDEAMEVTGLTLQELESLGRVVEYDFDNLPIESGLRFPKTEEELIQFEQIFPDTKTCDDFDQMIEDWYNKEHPNFWTEEYEALPEEKKWEFLTDKFLEDHPNINLSEFKDIDTERPLRDLVMESVYYRALGHFWDDDDNCGDEDTFFAGAGEPEEFYDDDLPFETE